MSLRLNYYVSLQYSPVSSSSFNSTRKLCWHSRFIQNPGWRRAVLKGTQRPAFKTIFNQVSGLVRNQLQFRSRRIDLTPTNYFLRPETRHRPHQSSQYDAFLSQARDQCFTRLNETKYGNILDDCRLCQSWDLCFIRLNDAFRKTLLQKLTDHGK